MTTHLVMMHPKGKDKDKTVEGLKIL